MPRLHIRSAVARFGASVRLYTALLGHAPTG